MSTKRPRKFGIIAFKPKPEVMRGLGCVLAWAEQRGVSPYLHRETLIKKLPGKARLPKVDDKGLQKMDVILALGGDGTLLSAARRLLRSRPPVAGISVGGLGFLTDIPLEDLETSLDAIANGRFKVVERMMIDVKVVRGKRPLWQNVALNEAVVCKTSVAKLARFSLWSGRKFISRFWVDGLIVATPTGSTAYSLSAGGPILYPSVQALAITPISPHSLTERPMVVPADRGLRIVVDEKRPPVLVMVDGKAEYRLQQGDEVFVTRSRRKTRLIKLGEANHFDTLRNKLGWSKK